MVTTAGLAFLGASCAEAGSTINSTNDFVYGANAGWMNAYADGVNGAIIGQTICSGCIYSANCGWISLGNGAPTNGVSYQNLSAGDFGVNRDGQGNLRGFAYSANLGWINFEATGAPEVNLTNGVLSGYAWSANAGWISLSNSFAQLQTSTNFPASGEGFIWIDPAGGYWNTAANWLDDSVPSGAGIAVDFSTLVLDSSATVTLEGPETVGSMAFGDQGNAFDWFVTAGAGVALDLSGSVPAITVDNQTTTLALAVTGTQGLIKEGAGTLVLSQPVSYTGATTNNGGVLKLVGAFNTYLDSPLAINEGVVESGGTLCLNTDQNTNAGSTNVVGKSILRLAGTTNGPASPDLYFGQDQTGFIYFGAQIDAAILDLGSAQRYIYARSGHNSVSRWRNWEDARINSDIIGTGGITYIAQNNNAGGGGNQPMECNLVLAGSNTFTGGVEIQRGSVYLLNSNALSQTNALLMDPAAGNTSKFFLYGNNTTVANLASSGSGTALIANGTVVNNVGIVPAGTLTVDETANTVFGGQMVDTNYDYDAGNYYAGPLSLSKIGLATLTLTGSNFYHGPTLVAAGTLIVNGSLSDTPTTVASGGTLAGVGSVAGAVVVSGSIAPGANSVGTFTTGPETWNSSASMVFSISNTASSGGSLLNINGGLSITANAASPFTIELASLSPSGTPGLVSGFNPSISQSWIVATASSGISGFAAGSFSINTSAFSNAFSGVFSVTTNANSLVLNYTAPAGAVTPPSGIVAWWPANGNAIDVIGGDDGTLSNGVSYVAGEAGLAFNFDNDSAIVVLSDTPALQLQNFTIEMWLRRDSLANVTLDGQATAGNALIFGYGHLGYSIGMRANGDLLLTCVDQDEVVSTAAVSDLNWHHVAVTTTNGVVVFYLDGVPYPAGSYARAYQFTTLPAIGGRDDHINGANNDSFLGSVDELSVYNRALSASEILSIYNAGSSGKVLPPPTPYPAPPGIVAWWPGNSNTVDVVGGNNGMLTNGAGYTQGEAGAAFNFTNNHSGVFIGNPTTALQLQNLTIEAWVKRAATSFVSDDPTANGGAAAIFYFGTQGYGMGMQTDGAISLTKIDVDAVTEDSPGARVADTSWHHVAITKTNTVVTFYIDGVAYPPFTYNSTFQFTTPAGIGVRGDLVNGNNNDSFAGAIDELSIYSRALTPSEILSIYNAGSAGKVLPAPPQSLSIARNGRSVTITWPAAGGFTLQQTTNLANAASWMNSTNAVTASNGTNSASINATGGCLFFRLIGP